MTAYEGSQRARARSVAALARARELKARAEELAAGSVITDADAETARAHAADAATWLLRAQAEVGWTPAERLAAPPPAPDDTASRCHAYLATTNHELRTPLAKLTSHAELLLAERDALPADLRGSVEVVVSAAAQLTDAVRRLTVDLEAMPPALLAGAQERRAAAVDVDPTG